MKYFRLVLAATVAMLPLFLSAAEQNSSIGRITSLAVDSRNSRLEWAVSDSGLFRSRDGGATWHAVSLHLSSGTRASRVWVVDESSPTVFVSTTNRGLLRSTDEGTTWNFANYGLPHGIGAEETTPIVSLASSGTPSSTVYALSEAQGIFRSIDNGSSWSNASSGLPVPFFNRTDGSMLSVHPLNPERLYVLLNLPVTSHHNRVILFASTSGGRSWSPLKEMDENFRAESMEVDNTGALTLHKHDGDLVIDAPDYLGSEAPAMTYIDLLGGGFPSAHAATSVDRDEDNIAILEDDGSLIYREFDLSEQTIEFRPNTDNTYKVSLTGSLFEPALGDPITLGDEDAQSIALPFAFPFYSQSWTKMYINSNGSVSFEKGDRSSFPQVSSFVSGVPRIAPLWSDLDPTTGGNVLAGADTGKIVITWNAVQLWRQPVVNTFQVVLFSDGRIRLNYGAVGSKAGITGISNGYQKDGNYVVFNTTVPFTPLRPLPIMQQFRTPDIDPIRVAQRFYQTHDDDFDELVYFAASGYPATVASGGAAYFARVKNEVRGIGVSLGDFASQLGSAGRLRGVINMNSLAQYPNPVSEPISGDPSSATAVTILGQEALHRFGAFVRFREGTNASAALLGRSASHWNYFLNTDGSVMEGNEWSDNGNGTFTAGRNFVSYSKLDAYLMGLRAASEIPPLMLITNPEPLLTGRISAVVSSFGGTDNAIRDAAKDFGSPDRLKGLVLGLPFGSGSTAGVFISKSGPTDTDAQSRTISTNLNLRTTLGTAVNQTYTVTKFASSAPQGRYYNADTDRFDGENIVVKGTRRDVSIADVIESEGERVPAKGTAPTSFTQAFILIVPAGTAPSSADLAKASAVRRMWEPFFSTSTDGLGSMSTEIKPGMSRVSREVAGGGMTSIGTRGTSSAVSVGYGRLESGTEQAVGVALVAGVSGDRTVTETAVPAAGTLRRARLFVERTGSVKTAIAVSAPYAAVSIDLQLRGNTGTIVASTTINLEARNQLARFVDELFPSSSIPAEFKGSLTLIASVPITVAGLRSVVNENGEFLIAAIPPADLETASSPVSYLTYFADGNGYSSNIVLINSGSGTVSGVVEFHAPTGALQPVRMNSADSSSTRYNIPAHGLQIVATEGSSDRRDGYVVIRADAGQDTPIIRGIVNVTENGVLRAMTSEDIAGASRLSRAFVDFSEGRDSGLSLLNASAVPAEIRLAIYGSDGSALLTPVKMTLAPQSQTTQLVSEVFPRLPQGFRGTIEMVSNSVVQLTALHVTSSAGRLLLTTYPAEPMDIPRSDRILFFPYLVDGAGFRSEIFIGTLGTAASTPRLSFMSHAGDSLRLAIAPTR